MTRYSAPRGPVALVLLVVLLQSRFVALADETLKLHTRSQAPVQDSDGTTAAPAVDKFVVVEKDIDCDPRHTALIICDMWDDHWCRGAAARVTELAGPTNKLAHRARDLGMLVIHAPSTCVDFYKDMPGRRRAQSAPYAKPPLPLSDATRWGTRWCWPDPKREPALPIDDSDMGCDCAIHCEIRSPWTRQIATIEIEEPDAISDDGQEVYNLLEQRGIDRVLIAGVHLNMCVLGRSFAIRQMVALGKQVVLVRDLTDTMYNSRMKPFTDHFRGTDLVVEHVERHWCPTITSADLSGGSPFRFREDKRK
ncbi:MAG TPA: cysteine hydrolase family protein [Pirellulales bacterium]|nr:cysteine hydrolase family protein [Pirellulales bacterium]